MKDNQLEYKIALTKLPHVGVKTAKVLMSYCGSLESIFKEKVSSLLRIPGIGPKTVHAIANCDPFELASADCEFLRQRDISTTFFFDRHYPSRLKYFDDAPLLLYYEGKADWNCLRSVAVVGTRGPSEEGKQLCKTLIEDLQPYGTQIISGLAYGIDSIAHRASLSLKMDTIAVMGTGLDIVYPAINRPLSRKIARAGTLVTEYPIRTRADKENFPRRNRIIAGLSDVTVVVESAEKGGSLITAAYANEYNKDVVAFPGRPGEALSAGCNALIKMNKAHLIESADDLVQLMGWQHDRPFNPPVQSALFVDLDETEKSLLELLKHVEDAHIDWIQGQMSVTPGTLSSILLQLEFKNLVSALPGKRYRMRT